MRYLGMLPASRQRPATPVQKHFVADSSNWVRAEQDGIFRAVVPLGAHVDKGRVLGFIADPFGEREIAVKANAVGIVIGRTNLPLVHEGEALYHIAKFEADRHVARQVEAMQERLVADDALADLPIV